jgi:hypothetical protein
MLFKKKQEDTIDNLEGNLKDFTDKFNPPLPTTDLNDVYTIGNNRNGDTIISLKSGPRTTILTMGPAEVNRMIRLLKATLEHYEIEEDNKD